MIATQPPALCAPAPAFARMRTAAGGSNWNRIGETTAFGRASTSGLAGTARFDTDAVAGRSAQRFTIAVMGSSADVYDGRTLWHLDISGGVHPRDSAFPRALATTDAYVARRGYERPGSARFTCLGNRHENARDVTVIRVQPRNGIAADLSVDRQTGLLDRITERYPIETVVTDLSDYRTVAGVALPFSISSGSTFEPKSGYAIQVQNYRIRRRADGADFARPAERDGLTMRSGATQATVPLALEGRQLLVWASLDGHAPMPFILDTGGHAILTTQAARALGLRGSGSGESGGSGSGTIALQYTRVRSVQIGAAQLRDLPFLIIPYPYGFSERGPRQPIAGILGLEVFERLAVRIDAGRRALTFTPLAGFRYTGSARPVGLAFQDDMPMVEAAADGANGLFGVDTGNAGSLILFDAYLRHAHLLGHYPAGVLIQGQGTGGSNTARLETLRRFALGTFGFANVPAAFTNMQSGAFSSWTEAGNLGISILTRFVSTFDYAHERLYLDDALRGTIPASHAGMSFGKNGLDAIDVTLVVPNSPAARAGVRAGDRIVAVDGVPASHYSRADLFDVTLRPQGRLHLRIARGTGTRDVTLAWQ